LVASQEKATKVELADKYGAMLACTDAAGDDRIFATTDIFVPDRFNEALALMITRVDSAASFRAIDQKLGFSQADKATAHVLYSVLERNTKTAAEAIAGYDRNVKNLLRNAFESEEHIKSAGAYLVRAILKALPIQGKPESFQTELTDGLATLVYGIGISLGAAVEIFETEIVEHMSPNCLHLIKSSTPDAFIELRTRWAINNATRFPIYAYEELKDADRQTKTAAFRAAIKAAESGLLEHVKGRPFFGFRPFGTSRNGIAPNKLRVIHLEELALAEPGVYPIEVQGPALLSLCESVGTEYAQRIKGLAFRFSLKAADMEENEKLVQLERAYHIWCMSGIDMDSDPLLAIRHTLYLANLNGEYGDPTLQIVHQGDTEGYKRLCMMFSEKQPVIAHSAAMLSKDQEFIDASRRILLSLPENAYRVFSSVENPRQDTDGMQMAVEALSSQGNLDATALAEALKPAQ